MRQRKLGSLEVSAVGLGCNNFGIRIDQARTQAVVDAAFSAGINLFDTADVYGGTKSEEFLSKALGNRRDKIFLATKFGSAIDEQHRGARPDYIRQAVEASLRRLGTDRIDLYQMHCPDPQTPMADTLGALNELVIAGKVREIGCSNFSLSQLAEAEQISGESYLAKFVSVQNEYSLLKRGPETDGVLNQCAVAGVAFLPYYPLASGLLTGKYRKGKAVPENARLAPPRFADRRTDDKLDVVEKLIAFCRARGHTILELAFCWLLRQPTVASVIAGATRPEQVAANVGAAEWTLSDADLAEVETLLESAE